jgi:hypothetical protein
MAGSVPNRVLARINDHPLRWTFGGADFADLGSNVSIRAALCRLAREGVIRRLKFSRYARAKFSGTSDRKS